MRRSKRTWVLFAAGVIIVLGVMGFISKLIIEGEEKQALARAEADHRARERTALWRLDSALSPMVANETGRAIASIVDSAKGYGPPPGFFSLFFSVSPLDGVQGYGPTAELSDENIAYIKSVDLERLKNEVRNDPTWKDPLAQSIDNNIVGLNGVQDGPMNFKNNDLQVRNQRRMLSNSLNPMTNSVLQELGLVELTPFTGFWTTSSAGEILVLARPCDAGGSFQFVLVDWDELSPWLTDHVKDILPDASLARAESFDVDSDQALLTELPLRLVSKPFVPSDSAATSVAALLISGWGAVLLALVCIAVVLHLSLKISHKRARFVSTVTHELRTPITTFRMYSQMLADGMIAGEDRRQEYLQTLKEESERISRVLESVLLYSRLEEGRAEARREVLDAVDLLDGLLVPMTRQADVLGLDLSIDFESDGDNNISTDKQVVEQIMLNLLENAAKYAGPTAEVVELRSSVSNGALHIDLADHGPGVPAEERKLIFKEFHRGEGKHLDGFAGLGLGLALGRELAQGLGGSLVLLDGNGPGATFRLSLPVL